jgi:hypothetical protein
MAGIAPQGYAQYIREVKERVNKKLLGYYQQLLPFV